MCCRRRGTELPARAPGSRTVGAIRPARASATAPRAASGDVGSRAGARVTVWKLVSLGGDQVTNNGLWSEAPLTRPVGRRSKHPAVPSAALATRSLHAGRRLATQRILDVFRPTPRYIRPDPLQSRPDTDQGRLRGCCWSGELSLSAHVGVSTAAPEDQPRGCRPDPGQLSGDYTGCVPWQPASTWRREDADGCCWRPPLAPFRDAGASLVRPSPSRRAGTTQAGPLPPSSTARTDRRAAGCVPSRAWNRRGRESNRAAARSAGLPCAVASSHAGPSSPPTTAAQAAEEDQGPCGICMRALQKGPPPVRLPPSAFPDQFREQRRLTARRCDGMYLSTSHSHVSTMKPPSPQKRKSKNKNRPGSVSGKRQAALAARCRDRGLRN